MVVSRRAQRGVKMSSVLMRVMKVQFQEATRSPFLVDGTMTVGPVTGHGTAQERLCQNKFADSAVADADSTWTADDVLCCPSDVILGVDHDIPIDCHCVQPGSASMIHGIETNYLHDASDLLGSN